MRAEVAETGRAEECDLLVIGSGAGGLSSAVTAAFHGLKVIVIEKEPVFGGTTAWSGGWMWVPRNPLARRAGIVEDKEAVRTYLRAELGNHYDAQRIEAFLEAAPHMFRSTSSRPRSSSLAATTSRICTARCPARRSGAAPSAPRRSTGASWARLCEC